MKLNIEELISQSNEAAKLALDHHLHEGFDRERMKAFARLIVERCATTARVAFDSGWDGPTVAGIIRNLMED